MTSRRSSRHDRSHLWIMLWLIGSILPLVPYTFPLWIAAFSDNPYAYLIWIPIFSFVWASLSIWRTKALNSDAELSTMMGLVALGVAGTLLVVGRTKWQLIFVSHSAGLLVWPLWSLGLAWVLFGVGTTAVLWRPLLYLALAWPPLYSSLVSMTNPVLDAMANGTVRWLSSIFRWLTPGSPVGTYLVTFGHTSVTVYVSSVCSGADSLLAMLILFPIIMVSFSGSIGRKLWLTLMSILLALAANLLRLLLIIVTLHQFGSRFALGILHPVLGVLLFTGMVLFTFWIAHKLGLKNRALPSVGKIGRPSLLRLSVAGGTVSLLTLLLLPLYYPAAGSVRKPVVVATSTLANLMPAMPGWHQQLVGNYDASSILGPGAKSTAVTYTTFQGDYALAEMWWTYHPLMLQGYGEQNCLLFHGASLLDTRTIKLSNAVEATVYTVLLPAKQVGGTRDVFTDTVYEYNVNYHQQNAYIRMEIAAPVLLNVKQNSNLDKQISLLIEDLLSPSYHPGQSVPPADANRTVYLHNYFMFVNQFTRKALNS